MAPEPVHSSVRIFSEPLYNAKGWLKFIGVMNIIWGALQILGCCVNYCQGMNWLQSVLGFMLSLLWIWMGTLLFSSGAAIGRAYETDQEEEMIESLGKLATYFRIMGALNIVAIVIVVVVIFFGIAFTQLIGTGTCPIGTK